MFLAPPPERLASPADVDVATMYRNKIFKAVQNDASGETSDETLFRCRQPRASPSLSAAIYLNVLNNSYDRMIKIHCIFEHIQWRWALNDRLGGG
jgi:hypothetical protein